jgi:hypothetical protein
MGPGSACTPSCAAVLSTAYEERRNEELETCRRVLDTLLARQHNTAPEDERQDERQDEA